MSSECGLLRAVVPNWIGHSNNPEYRFIAIRERLHKPPLPGGVSVGVVDPRNVPDRGWYKVTGVVTNRRSARRVVFQETS